MPDRVTRYTVGMAWANLVCQIVIVLTGGLVRLTASGLGCPTWPKCTAESLVPTPEMGIHGIIEFGNRTLTGVLCVVALLCWLSVLRTRGSGMRLALPAFLIGCGIILQAVVGGVTVITKLDPGVVGVHFLISGLLAATAALYLFRVRRAPQLVPVGDQRVRFETPRSGVLLVAALVVYVWTWVTLFVGALTTGSGPHAGDTAAARNGLDTEIMAHVHSWPGYILLASTLVFAVLAIRARARGVVSASVALLVLIAAQATLGVYQARTGLPVTAVAVHMILAVTIVAVATTALLTVKRMRMDALEGRAR